MLCDLKRAGQSELSRKSVYYVKGSFSDRLWKTMTRAVCLNHIKPLWQWQKSHEATLTMTEFTWSQPDYDFHIRPPRQWLNSHEATQRMTQFTRSHPDNHKIQWSHPENDWNHTRPPRQWLKSEEATMTFNPYILIGVLKLSGSGRSDAI